MNIEIIKDKKNEEFSRENSINLITDYVNQSKDIDLQNHIKELHNADIADILHNLDPEIRIVFIEKIKSNFDPEILTYLNDSLRDEIVEELDVKQLASNSKTLEIDDAVDLVEDFEKSDQNTFLENIEENERKLIEEGLNYPEDSAGRLMQRNFVSFEDSWNVGQAIDNLRQNKKNLPEDFYEIYLINNDKRISGTVPLGRLMGSKREVNLSDIKNKKTRKIKVNIDQEEVAFLFNKYGLVSAPVINENENIIGSITVDDVVDVIEEEREEDILKLGGVGQTDIYDAVINTTRLRFSWLFLNLLTAIIASFVISFFQTSIEKVVALAVLMPIVASMGGNAGMQTLAVTIRAIATKELSENNFNRVVGKEFLIGILNGLIFAVITAVIVQLWFKQLNLSLLIGVSMILNMIVAGLFGILVPVSLKKLNIDPALASSVFVTTITDVIGFLSFLGLGSYYFLN